MACRLVLAKAAAVVGAAGRGDGGWGLWRMEFGMEARTGFG